MLGGKSKNLLCLWRQIGRNLHDQTGSKGKSGTSFKTVNTAQNVQAGDGKNTIVSSQLQGFQGSDHEFAHGRPRDIQNRRPDEEWELKDNYDEQENLRTHVQSKGTLESYENETVTANQGSCVSLSSVMQSTVPEPFNPQGRNPCHLNMPGGGVGNQQKFLYGNIHKNHPSKAYTTSARLMAVPVLKADFDAFEHLPCPQGVQGENCPRFQLWQDNSNKHQISSCEEHLQGVQRDRKDIAQIFAEQDVLRQKLCQDRHVNHGDSYECPYGEGVQDLAWNNDYQLSVARPIPHGVQGEDCEQFRLWLGNCVKYGLNNSAEQVHGVQDGLRAMPEIFREQNEMIHMISSQYVPVRMSSTSSTSGGEKEVSDNKSQQESPDNQLTQRQKLKRTVKDYGATVVVFHIGISLMSLGGFYLAVSSGLDVVSLLIKAGVGEAMLESRLAQGASTFVVAYAVHKVFAPVRIAITLSCTPFIVKYLRRIGVLKVTQK